MAEALTQAEIDALLSGQAMPEPAPAVSMITPEEDDTANRLSTMVSQAGKDVFTALLGHSSSLELIDFKEASPEMISSTVGTDVVIGDITYKGMVQGKSVLITPVDAALSIASQMTGGGAEGDFGDLEESAFSEALQNVFSNVNTQIANQTDSDISIETIDVNTKPPKVANLLPASSEKQILVEYKLISGDVSATLYQVIPRNLLHSFSSVFGGTAVAQEEEQREYGSSAKAPSVMAQPPQFGGDMGGGMSQAFSSAPSVDLGNLELILDISIEVKVELGRTHRKIKDVLELGPGSVVELERLAGEPVDVLVNDKLFAKGEVVVIDENFGVRITDILSIQERIEALK
jgi:flagellar motor switch protein FliN/FliY